MDPKKLALAALGIVVVGGLAWYVLSSRGTPTGTDIGGGSTATNDTGNNGTPESRVASLLGQLGNIAASQYERWTAATRNTRMTMAATSGQSANTAGRTNTAVYRPPINNEDGTYKTH